MGSLDDLMKNHSKENDSKLDDYKKQINIFIEKKNELFENIEKWLSDSINTKIVSTSYLKETINENPDYKKETKKMIIEFLNTKDFIYFIPKGVMQFGGIKESGDVLGVIELYCDKKPENKIKLLFHIKEDSWVTKEMKFINEDYLSELLSSFLK